ncbi:MAG: MerR family transcriptional regulator [Holophagaceae bacterium]|nr:MerR family transcriptional regulator [Holophagaceae bacterium]
MPSSRSALRMAEVSRLCGISDQAIRFYERKGLILPVGRTLKGHRVYSPESLQSIRALKTAQSMGFSLDEIQTILKANSGEPDSCKDLQDLLEEKLKRVREMIGSLVLVETKIVGLLEQCAPCDGTMCPLRTDMASQEAIAGQRRCICLGGELGPTKGADPKANRSDT